jgi:hypothetical protein
MAVGEEGMTKAHRLFSTAQEGKTTCVKTDPDHSDKIACFTWRSMYGGCPTYGSCNPCNSDCKVTGYTYWPSCIVYECI